MSVAYNTARGLREKTMHIVMASMGEEGLSGDTADAAEDGFERPVALVVGKANLARAADFGAVVPALDESEVGLSLCACWWRGVGERTEDSFETGLEKAAGDSYYCRHRGCAGRRPSLRG